MLQGQCTVNPPGALDESITAKSGEVIEIACSTDSQPDSCTFTHMHPENMNYNGNSNTQEQVKTDRNIDRLIWMRHPSEILIG